MLSNFVKSVVAFAKDESGPTAVEYAVMLALIIVVCITAITALGTNANNTFSYVATKIGGTAGS
jgi:pilus assembly protein Flp/PilA